LHMHAPMRGRVRPIPSEVRGRCAWPPGYKVPMTTT
jgi:hypothetical protein